jgi:hypothetical protein
MPATVRPPLPVTAGRSTFAPSDPKHIDPPAPGLSPSTHPLIYRQTWGSFAADAASNPREFTSAPIRAPLGAWLKFETAGAVGTPGTTLELRDAATGIPLASIVPDQTPGDTWRAAYVRAPAGAFVIHAHTPDSARWLAFSEPIELASGSYWAWQLTKNGQLVATLALALALLTAVAALVLRRVLPIAQPSSLNSRP